MQHIELKCYLLLYEFLLQFIRLSTQQFRISPLRVHLGLTEPGASPREVGVITV